MVTDMKCRSLRRRYVVFEVSGQADDRIISQAIHALYPARTMIKLIKRADGYAIVRFDHLTARELRGCPPIKLNGWGSEMRPVTTTGTVLKAREKIKKLLRKQ